MDKDGDGTIDFEEFESWWRANGGDLESKRHLAMTIVVEGDVQLLLVREHRAIPRLPSAALSRELLRADATGCQRHGTETKLVGRFRGSAWKWTLPVAFNLSLCVLVTAPAYGKTSSLRLPRVHWVWLTRVWPQVPLHAPQVLPLFCRPPPLPSPER